jgi:hypothetical protein
VIGAHRVAYAIFHEGLPAGMDVHHACGHNWCVNPLHLRLVPRAVHANLGRGEYIPPEEKDEVPF